MLEQFGTELKTEGQPAFPVDSKETDNSSESSTEKTNTEQTQSQEGDQNSSAQTDASKKEVDNFADHPRWKQREEDWKQRFNDQEARFQDKITELSRRLDGSKPKAETPIEVPEWFGGDETAYQKYQQDFSQALQKALEQKDKERLDKEAEEKKRMEDASNFMNSEVAAIEADKDLNPNGLNIDRNKLLKFALDNKLVDTEGRWNYKAAFKLMKAEDVFKMKGALNEKKEVASATSSEARSESKPSAFSTSKDFSNPANRPW